MISAAMPDWIWSWFTLAALIGSVANIALGAWLAIVATPKTIRSRIYVPAEIALHVTEQTIQFALQALISVANRRGLLVWLGAFLQSCALAAAGLAGALSIPSFVPVIVQALGIATTAMGYAKWKHTFHPQSVANVVQLISERIHMASKGDFSYLRDL